MSSNNLQIVPRLSVDRGNADHGWLKTFHTFSFASYQGSGHEKFGSLRVINEDRVEPKTGFGTHSHREFEIFSYIVNGELQHNDSMGNVEVLKRGDIQLTSAGTGISHSEKAHGDKQVHFLQIWSLPSISKLTPTYFTRHFTDDEKKDKWVRVVAPAGAPGVSSKREDSGPTPVQSPLTLYSTILSPSTTLPHTFPAGSSKGYIHVIQTSGYNPKAANGGAVKVSGGDGVEHVLREGDGAYISAAAGKELNVENVGDRNAEVLLFDLE
ncbi:hypothetical protein PILCRDRAFT_62552 [Piloderma croceum F 1598]|uniref:Pirin N-terminal domain-containing protein n=1 Tax=Piloderma croceum (strain F 1598) TaxID=765440 RepID=A0A0C3CEV7_PILCF|nr:hypothetical protein PILCRDRAFT_62552 [Piloderma croceum F 1598]